jgi:hypothetical protein
MATTEANFLYANQRVILATLMGDKEGATLWAKRVTELAKQMKEEKERQQ